MKQEQTTIKDIAKELGVSISTVSRALADNPLVKPSTKQAIKELAKEKNYHPNFTALSLRQRKTKTIGLLVPQVVHEFFAHVIEGIEEVAYSSGYNVIISSSNDSYDKEKKNATELLNGRVDGLLACITKETSDISHLQEFLKRDVPLVFFDCASDKINTDKVVIDDLDAAYTATKHLIDIGCKKIAFVGGPKSLPTNQERYNGYAKAIREFGLPTAPELSIYCDSGNFSDGHAITKPLFENRGDFPDGVFAATDMLAIGAMKNIKKAGLNIPKDVAVVGFSNWEISQIYEPSLTTVDQRGYDIGKLAIEKLLGRLNNDGVIPYTTEIIKTVLIKRESTQR